MTTPTSHLTAKRALNRLFRERFRAHCRPRPRLTMSQWAEQKRIINGAPWRNSTAPYLVAFMDWISDPDVQEVTIIAPSQSGKSELIINGIGYFAEQEPSPQLLVQPTVEMGERFSKERIGPLIRENPSLQRVFPPPKSRSENNTTTSKSYPGGQLDIVGANAPAGLAMSPKRVVWLDERDRHPRSAGSEGDVKAIARARTRRFGRNRKIVEVSSPTDAESSLVHPSYNEGTKQHVLWTCEHCHEAHHPKFEQLRYERDEASRQVIASSVRLVCPLCQHEHGKDRERTVKRTDRLSDPQPARVPHKRSGWVHGILAAFHTWAEIAQEFVTANEQADPAMRADMLRAFFNTTLGELYVDKAAETTKAALLARAKRYDGGSGDEPLKWHVPAEAAIIVAGFDAQDDRLHGIVRAYGPQEESWLIERVIFYGDVTQDRVWEQLEQWRQAKRWMRPSGQPMPLRSMCIDSGDGEHAKRVYEYCAPRLSEGVRAIKGHSKADAPMLPAKPTKVKPGRLWVIGSHAIMGRIQRRLTATEPGPGFLHLNEYANEDYVTQMLSMRQVYDREQRARKWIKSPNVRCEDPDAEAYAHAALQLGPVPISMLGEEQARLAALDAEFLNPAPKAEVAVATTAPAKTSWLPSTGSGWLR